jgi:riboflavin synthase
MSSPWKPTWRDDVFTGIIEETGEIAAAGHRLRVKCKTVIEDACEGSSIAVNGVCLTVVNLDAAGAIGDRLSGHIV